MANLLTIFLTISTLLTGTIWIFYFIKKIKKYLINKKIIQNNELYRYKTDHLHTKVHFLKQLASFFPVLLLVFVIRSFIYEPFCIPSGSMMPTLLIGDLILVEKFSYGIKDPITHRTLINTHHPKRGDIVVFRHPNNTSINYIKRIIGLPGDRIIYNIKNKHIYICENYVYQKNCYKKISIQYSKGQKSDFIQKIYFLNKNNLVKEEVEYNSLYFNIVEEKINNIKHNILISNEIKNSYKDYYQQKNISMLTWIVPKGEYFMMGDNRDNSLDSRYWGFVPEKNLVGKAIKIWMSFDKNENEWPTGIRINRIGNIY